MKENIKNHNKNKITSHYRKMIKKWQEANLLIYNKQIINFLIIWHKTQKMKENIKIHNKNKITSHYRKMIKESQEANLLIYNKQIIILLILNLKIF